jgi:hypothetical protein
VALVPAEITKEIMGCLVIQAPKLAKENWKGSPSKRPNCSTAQNPILTTTTTQNNKNNSIFAVYELDLVIPELFRIF